jgi:hypothetical protein
MDETEVAVEKKGERGKRVKLAAADQLRASCAD